MSEKPRRRVNARSSKFNPLDVRQRKIPKVTRLLVFAPCDEIMPVAVDEAIRVHFVEAGLAGAAVLVVKLDLAACEDRLPERRNDVWVDPRPWAGAHGDAFCLGKRFQIGCYPGERIRPHQCAQLGDGAFGVLGLHEHVLASQERHAGGQIGELLGRDGGKAGDRASGKTPALGKLAGIGLLHLREDAFDRIPEPLGGAPAERLVGIVPLDVLERQPLGRPLHIQGDPKDRIGFLVAHRPPRWSPALARIGLTRRPRSWCQGSQRNNIPENSQMASIGFGAVPPWRHLRRQGLGAGISGLIHVRDRRRLARSESWRLSAGS